MASYSHNSSRFFDETKDIHIRDITLFPYNFRVPTYC
jgi:hypothetical protein